MACRPAPPSSSARRPFLGVLVPFVGLVTGLAACESEVTTDRTPDPTAPITPEGPRGDGDPARCDPGEKTLHRLNRGEYHRTVIDLLGVDGTPANTFPADDVAKGFDNNADILSTSPLLTEKYVDAAHVIVDGLFATANQASTLEVEAEELTGSNGRAVGEGYKLVSTGDLTATFILESGGRYRVIVRADQDAAGPDAAQMRVSSDAGEIGTVDVTGLANYEFETTLPAGSVRITARFLNDFYNPDAGEDRNLFVDRFTVEGPLDQAEPGPGVGRFVTCEVDGEGNVGDVDAVNSCARDALGPLLKRAFRRPVSETELAPYVGLVSAVVAEGDSFGEGLEVATEAILLSPSFLFRVEGDPDGDGVHRLTDHELATRLSYFVWGSMPDDELLALADAGELSRRDIFPLQVQRMLASPKVKDGLATALAAQWLDTNGLDNAEPDPEQYPLSDEVRIAMKTETRLVVEALLAADRPAVDLLDVEFTFLNDILAAHYGLPFPAGDLDSDVDGDGFIKVELGDSNRRGVLTHGAFLTGHSYPFRTSPVKRGRFVVDAMLCIPPGDIPPDVPPLSEDASTGSVRERMEQHRSDPSCAACHAMMDPIGFGLESFDPVGRHRTVDDGGYAIDDDDVFFDVAFDGPGGMAAALKGQSFITGCMTERIGGYAIGRGLDSIDEGDFCTIADVVNRSTQAGFSWADFVLAIATADAFQMRQPSADLPAATTEDDGV